MRPIAVPPWLVLVLALVGIAPLIWQRHGETPLPADVPGLILNAMAVLGILLLYRERWRFDLPIVSAAVYGALFGATLGISLPALPGAAAPSPWPQTEVALEVLLAPVRAGLATVDLGASIEPYLISLAAGAVSGAALFAAGFGVLWLVARLWGGLAEMTAFRRARRAQRSPRRRNPPPYPYAAPPPWPYPGSQPAGAPLMPVEMPPGPASPPPSSWAAPSMPPTGDPRRSRSRFAALRAARRRLLPAQPSPPAPQAETTAPERTRTQRPLILPAEHDPIERWHQRTGWGLVIAGLILLGLLYG